MATTLTTALIESVYDVVVRSGDSGMWPSWAANALGTSKHLVKRALTQLEAAGRVHHNGTLWFPGRGISSDNFRPAMLVTIIVEAWDFIAANHPEPVWPPHMRALYAKFKKIVNG